MASATMARLKVVGVNEDLRLCVFVADADEDLHDACKALFGRSVDEPVDVTDEPLEPVVDDNNGRCVRPSTLAVWLDFEKLFVVEKK